MKNLKIKLTGLIILSVLFFYAKAQNCWDLTDNPYTMGFETSEINDFNSNWRNVDGNYDENFWTIDTDEPYSGNYSLIAFGYNNDSLISRCFNMNSNKEYIISFWILNSSLFGNTKSIKLIAGYKNNIFDTVLLDIKDMKFKTYKIFSALFKPKKDSTYYFCWVPYGEASSDYMIYIDDIEIKEFACTASVDLGVDDTICEGSSKQLDAGADFATYLWKKDGVQVGTERYLTVDTAGVYSVDVVDQFDCETNDEINISLFSYPETMSCLVYQNGKDTLINSLSVCDKQTVVLVSGLNAAYKAVCDINWYEEDRYSPISTSDTLRVTTPGVYYYKALHKTLGCEQQSSNSVYVNIKYPYSLLKIFVAQTDTVTGKNIIQWEIPTDKDAIANYNIYREKDIAGVYDKIGTVINNGTINHYVDSTSNPEVKAEKYKISLTDTCGNESELSDYHKTMHLSISPGIGNKYNLIWDNYIGKDYTTFVIYRSNKQNMGVAEEIASVASTTFAYTDIPPLGDTVSYYVIGIVKKGIKKDEVISFSNVVSSKSVGINELGMGVADLKIYPNPASERLNVEFLMLNEGKVDIRLLDITGREVAVVLNEARAIGKNNVAFNIGNIDKGIYFMRAAIGENLMIKKIIKN
ncbi:MAG: T9SS type A sorting domain-containing protein [Bacteroidales bacterium]|nr:T9SS type A sorting domain-containing protein [Bacteroidales bacterium]